MLVLTLKVGESVLAENLFELHYREKLGANMKFELEVKQRSPFLLLGHRGVLESGLSYPQEPAVLNVQDLHRLKVLECEIGFELYRESGVKLAITAPRSVRISRPLKHGTSLRSA